MFCHVGMVHTYSVQLSNIINNYNNCITELNDCKGHTEVSSSLSFDLACLLSLHSHINTPTSWPAAPS